MSEPFVAEIRAFAYNFPPKGWAFCNGQLMQISQNTALFTLLGTTFGGDGKTTFGLPDLQGRGPMQQGHGPGLSPRALGESGGSEQVTLGEPEMPVHSHNLIAASQAGGTVTPAANLPAKPLAISGTQILKGAAYSTEAPDKQMAPQSIKPSGSGQPHNNVQLCTTLNFCIALQGLYPTRG